MHALHSRSSLLRPGRAVHQPFQGIQAKAAVQNIQLATRRCSAVASAIDTAAAPIEDKWISRTVQAFKEAPAPSSLQTLQEASRGALATLRMPSTRNEEYRFTDISPLLKSHVKAAAQNAALSKEFVEPYIFPEASGSVAVVVDGVLQPQLSQLDKLPEGMYVGSIQGAPADIAAKLGSLSASRGGPFAAVNSALAQDAVCIAVSSGVHCEQPLYVLYISTGTSDGKEVVGNAPRLLVHAAAGSAVEVIEEYVAADRSASHYFTCSIAEMFVEPSAELKHGYVEREGSNAYHFKGTLVQQADSSTYALTEAQLGGSLTRHDLGVQQAGPETNTQMRHFLLCGANQLHDLHTKLNLNHPNGQANQLHKCIVSHASGRGVFDGNVKVNRLAQKTDAGQLSRNLLLVPRATVNVKPNLQIIADDVKCTHGAAISDLSEEELFYFRARGIDAATARQSLVTSFGAEVVQHLKYAGLRNRIQADISAMLKQVDDLFVESADS